MSSVQQLWNIPRFLELKTCFNSKNITVSDPAANMTKEIQVSPTQLNIAVKVRSPLCCPNLTFTACTITVRKQKHALHAKNSFQLVSSSSYKRAIQRSKPKVPVLCPTALRVAESYTRDYILIANFVAMLLLPFLIITSLNFRLFKTIKV